MAPGIVSLLARSGSGGSPFVGSTCVPPCDGHQILTTPSFKTALLSATLDFRNFYPPPPYCAVWRCWPLLNHQPLWPRRTRRPPRFPRRISSFPLPSEYPSLFFSTRFRQLTLDQEPDAMWHCGTLKMPKPVTFPKESIVAYFRGFALSLRVT